MKKIFLLLSFAFLLSCTSEPEISDNGVRSPASSSDDEGCSAARAMDQKDPSAISLSVCHFQGDDEKKHDLKFIQLKDIHSLLAPELRTETKNQESKVLPSSGSGFFSPQSYNQPGVGSLVGIDINGGSGDWNIVLVSGPAHKYYLITDSNGIAVAGANDMGVSVSLHGVPSREVVAVRSISSTTPVALSQETEILAQFLAEGKSPAELEAELQTRKIPGHWAAFFVDSSKGVTSTLEIGHDKVRLWQEPPRNQKPVGQSNHFLHAQMQDQYEFESFGAALDSHARYLRLFDLVSHLKPQELSLSGALGILGDHYDGNVPRDNVFGNERSYGSTVVRSDTRGAALMVPDSVHPKVWISINDHDSGPMSHLAGFEMDFKAMSWKALGVIQNHREDVSPNWVESLDDYADGAYKAANGNWEDAVTSIENAIAAAEKDRNRFDPYYHFAKARILLRMASKEDDLGIKKEELIIALDEFERILSHQSLLGNMKSSTFFGHVTGASLVESYIEAMAKLYSVAAAVGLDDVKSTIKSEDQQSLIESHLMNSDTKNKRLLAAEDSLEFILKQTQNPDIRAKLKFLDEIKSKAKFDDLSWPAVDLVSIVN